MVAETAIASSLPIRLQTGNGGSLPFFQGDTVPIYEVVAVEIAAVDKSVVVG